MLEPMRTPELTFFAAAGPANADPPVAVESRGHTPPARSVVDTHLARAKGALVAYVPLLAIGLAPLFLQRLCCETLKQNAGLVVLL